MTQVTKNRKVGIKTRKTNCTNMFDVIVYDNTETENEHLTETPMPSWMVEMLDPEPGSLTWWWKMGGILQSARQLADAVGGAGNWEEALDFVINSFKEAKSNSREELILGSVQFWGHGSPGAAYMGGHRLDINSLNGDDAVSEKLAQLKELVTPGCTSIWFRSCNTFHGEEGKAFAIAYSEYFNTDIVGHTYIISALQSGTYILSPGETPEWTDDEGGTWSGIYEPHTITALRFYPPANW